MLAVLAVPLCAVGVKGLVPVHGAETNHIGTSERGVTQIGCGRLLGAEVRCATTDGTGALLGGALLQSGAVLISAVMLRSGVFSKTIASVGIVTHGFDLAHCVLGPLVPGASQVFTAIAGPLYLIWFPLVGRRLLQLGQRRVATAALGREPDGR